MTYRMRSQSLDLRDALAICVGLGIAFQIGHFAEHTIQFAVWVAGTYHWIVTTFCGRDVPYMSPLAMVLVNKLGALMFPAADRARQLMLGMEFLHLFGNFLFLSTIAGVFYFMPSKWARYGFYIEGGHLCEHLALCLTAFWLGKPIGVSTLFGQSVYWLGHEGAVGYRVAWHFAMNLVPMPLVMVGMMKHTCSPPLAAAAAE